MFDVSFTELLVIGVVALVVIGPERLPKVARTIGHLVGRAQRYVNDVKSDIQREVELDDLRKLKDQMQDAAQSVKNTLSDTEASFRKPLESFEQDTMSALKGDSAADATGAEPVPALAGGESTAISEGGAEFASAEQTTAGSEGGAEFARGEQATAGSEVATAPETGAAAETTTAAQATPSPQVTKPAPPRASVTSTDSPSASAHVAAASPTPPAELASDFETPSTPKQLELDGVVTGAIPEPLSHAERAAAIATATATATATTATATTTAATAQAAVATPKPGMPT